MNELAESVPPTALDPTWRETPIGQLSELWRQGQRPDVRQFLAHAVDLTLAQVVALLRVDQRERWQIGERIPAETYLQMYPGLAADPEKALELVYGEFLLREELTDSPPIEEYLQRFPQFALRLKQQVELHQALLSVSIKTLAGD